MRRTYIILLLLFCFTAMLKAQRTRFCNLTADEVRIDSVLPHVTYSYLLPNGHKDSIYSVQIKYPEYLDMPVNDIAKYRAITTSLPPQMPEITTVDVCSRKQTTMVADFCPVVFVDGKYKYLVSFMLEFSSRPAEITARLPKRSDASGDGRYASSSVLATGKWSKIRVSNSGIHQLTKAIIADAGFTDLSKVRIYGYGGNVIPEKLTSQYLAEYDDLKEIATCTVGDSKLFYANGPVSWDGVYSTIRTRNPYSDYGYYFITQSEDTPLTVSEEEFLAEASSKPERYHSLYEKDEYSWRKGGQVFVEKTSIPQMSSHDYSIDVPEGNTLATVTVAVSGGSAGAYEVYVNDSLVGTHNIELDSYDCAEESTNSYIILNVRKSNKVTIKNRSIANGARLDYISASFDTPEQFPSLTDGGFPSPEFVQEIGNQDLHSHSSCDLTIIVPASRNTLKQAQTLKDLHETKDGMSVRIVPADEIYNEFSSGTPDVSAYKRYMKMLYDRAETDEQQPKYLLLFGDCVWDNRQKTASTASINTDNYLLCYESMNSFSSVECFVSDDFIGLLDDNETLENQKFITGIPDIAIGRIPVSNAIDAQGVVNKIVYYANHSHEGTWQNTIMFLGDDGNSNLHMRDINGVADRISYLYPGYYIRKIYWDAYDRISSASGNRYPEVTSIVKQQQNDGALIIDYAGHGSEDAISHEYVLTLSDFNEFRGTNYPLWITASCEIMPFDGVDETIGETALLNSRGGAIAFFGTTRTVMSAYNNHANKLYMTYVLATDDNGRMNTLGDANRLTKDSLVRQSLDRTVNKLQYTLLGDPALTLARPQMKVVVDSINGYSVAQQTMPQVKAGSIVRVQGHIEGGAGLASDFNGLADIMMRDTKQTVTCKMNDTSADGASVPFVFTDRTNIIYQGTDSVVNGKFSFSLAVPKDINYSDDTGLINIYAYNSAKTLSAHGACDRFLVGGSETSANDSIGPSIWCYLNTPDFSNGDVVNTMPYFYAEIQDEDGINASGSGIGHDMQLTIDGMAAMTYNLNDNFKYNFGSYTSGTTYYLIPKLEEGNHVLRFRAWDVKNNCSQATLNFVVRNDMKPTINAMYATPNPASDSVKFIVSHDCPGNDIEVSIDVMDAAGRLIWSTAETTSTSSPTYTATWDLTLDSGAKLQTGIYLYRVKILSDTKRYTTDAKKLVIVRK